MGGAPALTMLPAGNASEWTGPSGTNTYLLHGAIATLIDAGVGHPDHVASIDRALAGCALDRILITHAHPDHAGGIPALLARWPRAQVRNAQGDACADGEPIAAGDGMVRAVYTPGHAVDHFCFVDERTRDLYCGDLARAGGTIVIPARAGGDLAAYLSSLRRVRDLAPRRLLPGHGPIVDDPAALLDAYLRHREDREAQVLDALAAGCSTPARIAQRIYGDLTPALTRAADDSILAHLKKLESERRAAERQDGWQLL